MLQQITDYAADCCHGQSPATLTGSRSRFKSSREVVRRSARRTPFKRWRKVYRLDNSADGNTPNEDPNSLFSRSPNNVLSELLETRYHSAVVESGIVSRMPAIHSFAESICVRTPSISRTSGATLIEVTVTISSQFRLQFGSPGRNRFRFYQNVDPTGRSNRPWQRRLASDSLPARSRGNAAYRLSR